MSASIEPSGGDEGAGRAMRSIADTAIASRFQSWLGASGRRYTVSVFPFDVRSPDRGLPDFDGCVVIPVCGDAHRGGGSRSVLGVFAIEGFRDARALRAAAGAVAEWHVHLLAEDRAAREAAVSDLRRRLAA